MEFFFLSACLVMAEAVSKLTVRDVFEYVLCM
jgi:hypothetical protein